MKNTPFYALFVYAFCYLQSCVAPINTTYDTARSLGKGNLEMAGGVTQYDFSSEPSGAGQNIGFRAGYGFSNKFDLKFRFETMSTPELEFLEEEWSFDRVRYVSIVPKFSLKQDMISLSTPISMYFLSGDLSEGNETTGLFSIGPTLLYTSPVVANKIDFTGGLKAEIFQGAGLIFGISAGAGFSNNLSRWALRPEIGLTTGVASGIILNYGIGTHFIFSTRKK